MEEMVRLIALLFVVGIILSSCEKDSGEVVVEDNNEVLLDTIVPQGDEKYLTGDSDYIFDQDRMHTFELEIPESNLAILNADPAAEEYVEGKLIFEGDTISPVGVRYKGSIGAFVNCVSGSDWTNPSGQKTCTKLSMKIKINWGSDTRFYGLRKLQFHAMNLDPSQMRDRLGYWLFRSMDVKAPRCTHARLMINGELNGVFALVEQIDVRFTRHNWEDGEGNLYKELWPLDSEGNVQDLSQLNDALKTNEDENPTFNIIQGFAEAVYNAEDSELKSVIENWMDVDAIIKQIVVDRTIRHDDGPFHWYCNGNTCAPHNFYWYEEPNNQKLHMIPWDLDNAFENIIFNSNPVTPILDEWGKISNNCQPFNAGFFGARQKSAACDRITYAWTLFDDEFSAYKNGLVQGPMSKAEVDMQLDKWYAQIYDAVNEVSGLHGDAVTLGQWSSAVEEIKRQLDHAREK